MTYHSNDDIVNHVVYQCKCFVGKKITRLVEFLNYDECEKWVYVNKDNYDNIIVCYKYI